MTRSRPVEVIREVRIRDHRIRVAVRPGDGIPLVLCNGIGASMDLLQPVVDAVDPAVPVVRFDVPGIGGSTPPRWPYNFATLAWLLGHLLDELGYDEVDVLGISWGGGLAQQFAFQNPHRCRRLVLVSTATGWMMVPGHPKVLSRMVTPQRYRDPEYAARIAGSIYGGRLREEPDLVRTVLHGHAPVTSRRGYLLQLLAGAGWASLPFLPLLRQPTLILAGDDDPIIPLVNARMMHSLLPRSELHVFPDGHLGLVTRADELGPLISAFVRPPGEAATS
ncbi:poly(3-hydroxyalkanoate) depolymerase [Nocardioides insulae]|uniref:poly(3-hydroxyalkanoate) depolymerase n=1 Tax=Nocardioides insulae TaxID=394734 RepID=UPI0003FD7332|nr:poly(3-hydroxyalkanoate) depolymerase [Nocardioides insulae]